MNELTRGQKGRLGLFLLLALGLLVAIVVIKVGESLFDHRDVYRVRMPGSVGALDPGSDVTFNGIVVGRVERVSIDPLDVGVVAIELSLAQDTPIPEDTSATVSMRGITGMKHVELTGGTNAARRRLPGEEIPAGRTLLDELEGRASGIMAKVDGLLADGRAWMQGPTPGHVEATLASVRRSTEAFEDTLVDNAPRLALLLERADEVASELAGLLVEARATNAALRETAMSTSATMRSVDKAVDDIGATVTRLGNTVDRIATQQVEPLVNQLTHTIGRAGVDVRTALDELVQTFESVGELADALKADPSSIIVGKSAKERSLP